MFDIQYSYDLARNRTNTVVYGTTNTYTLGIGNRLVEATSPSLSGMFGYDDAGNTVGITNIESGITNIQSLAWDERGEIIAHAATDNWLFENLEALEKLPVGVFMDKTCRRVYPTGPERTRY